MYYSLNKTLGSEEAAFLRPKSIWNDATIITVKITSLLVLLSMDVIYHKIRMWHMVISPMCHEGLNFTL